MKVATLPVCLLLLGAPPDPLPFAGAACPPPFDAAGRDPGGTASEAELLAAISALSGHVSAPVAICDTVNQTKFNNNETIQINDDRAKFEANKAKLTFNFAVLEAALALIDEYESVKGPLFIGAHSVGGFSRSFLSCDDRELERAILGVQQAVLDEVYHGSLWHPTHRSDAMDRPFAPIVDECADFLRGRKWNTSDYFPGAAEPPADDTVVHSVNVDATFSPRWGRRVAFSDDEDCCFRALRPIGNLYLSPGQIATVTVPAALVNAGFTVQVGGNMIDNFNKDNHRRMDRITTTFPLDGETITIANPLGGSLYLRIPYPSSAGVVSIDVSGGVTKSPRFALTSIETTTATDWDSVRLEPGPWVNLESDSFLALVPRMWVYNYPYAHMHALLANYTDIMNGITELVGIPPIQRNNYVGFISVDRYIRYGGYGIGYPQVNDLVEANQDGPKLSGFNGAIGAANFWMVVNPLDSDVCYHELGHAQLYGSSMYRGERESIVHVPYTYVRNVIYGDNIDVAFSDSIKVKTWHPNANRVPIMYIDQAAIDWMVRENFRLGNEMYWQSGPENEFQYQHRGHAKYADMARLFGWDFIKEFMLQESQDAESGASSSPCSLDDANTNDDRTFRLSLKVGVDLTPLVHFWGIQPQNEVALKNCMDQNGLLPSPEIKAQLERYATIVPMNQAAFIAHFDEIYPNKRDQTNGCGSIEYGCGWYNFWYPQWTETLAEDTVAEVENIVNRYFPTPAPTPVCVDLGTEAFCQRKANSGQCPHDNCLRTCGTCVGGPGPTPAPTPSPTPSLTPGPMPSPSPAPTPASVCVDLGSEQFCARKQCPHEKCRLTCGTCRRLVRRATPVVNKAKTSRELNVFGHSHLATEKANLNSARSMWKNKSPMTYTFELEYDFYGPDYLKGPFVCKVEFGEVVSVVNKESGRPVDMAYAHDICPSFDGLFDFVQRGLGQNVRYARTKYNPARGYPESIFFDQEAEGGFDNESDIVWIFVRNYEEM